jgi:hypothetical protein
MEGFDTSNASVVISAQTPVAFFRHILTFLGHASQEADAYRDRLAKRRGHVASEFGSVSYLLWRPKSQTIGSIRSPGGGEGYL